MLEDAFRLPGWTLVWTGFYRDEQQPLKWHSVRGYRGTYRNESVRLIEWSYMRTERSDFPEWNDDCEALWNQMTRIHQQPRG